jgi:hypothetical protein
MLNGTETLEDCVGFGPDAQLRVHGRGEFGERREVAVVQAKTAEQFPDALDGIELRTVGREKMEAKVWFLLPSPFGMQRRVVVLGIVGDDHHLATRTGTDTTQVA